MDNLCLHLFLLAHKMERGEREREREREIEVSKPSRFSGKSNKLFYFLRQWRFPLLYEYVCI